MSKNYDEGSVLTAVARRGVKVDYTNHLRPTLVVPMDGIGIHTWDKLDFLVNHCHYGLIRATGSAIKTENNKPSKKGESTKRDRKSHTLTDKTKKSNKRK